MSPSDDNKFSRDKFKKADDQEHQKENWDSEAIFVAKFSCQKIDKMPIYALMVLRHCISWVLKKSIKNCINFLYYMDHWVETHFVLKTTSLRYGG